MRALLPVLVASVLAAAEGLALGPMIGHVDATSARVWLATSGPAKVELTTTTGLPDVRRIVLASAEARTVVETIDPGSGVAARLCPVTIALAGLDPATRYSFRVEVDGVEAKTGLAVFTTAPPAGTAQPKRFAVVSCARCSLEGRSVWTALTADHPDAVLFLGDNNYFEPGAQGAPADWEDPRRMAFRHAQLRRTPALGELLRSAACYAIWDDHDYGPNDSDRTFALKEDSLRLFRAFWANPAYGSDGAAGVWSTGVRGDVQIVLCDGRFWRDPNAAPAGPDKTLLGAVQKEWLKRTLRASTARLKLVALGGQWLADYHRYESYAMFRHERDELLAFLASERIPGVILLSGDRHFSEIARLDRPGLYPLHELTASPAANRTLPRTLDQPNPLRIAAYAAGPSYGLIDHNPGTGTLTLRIKDAAGAEVAAHIIAYADLVAK